MSRSPDSLHARLSFTSSITITTTVALAAIALFAVSAWQIVPALVASARSGQPVSPPLLTAFLLNIALVLLAWRRSVQLRDTSQELVAAETRAEDLAYRDEVTGLGNRRRLNEVLNEVCREQRGPAALLLIDLDHFKNINDLYGHGVGDELLTTIAGRLVAAAPPGSLCFRHGGDEFAVLLTGTPAAGEEPEEFARDIQFKLAKPVKIAGTYVAVGTSIGVAARSAKTKASGDLMRRADLAMYEAKRRGRNRTVAFSEQMEVELRERNQLELGIRAGIEAGHFVPYFQPIIDLPSGDVRGFEVLARWKHPKRGLLAPGEFIARAEATGLISDLSFSVMHQALVIARSWPSHFIIAVNISPVQFNDSLLAQRVLKVLAETGFPAARLEIEVMEKSLLNDQSLAIATITSLRNSGIRISIDDFGTGYALLTELKDLPFDRIKIDRRFMQSLIDDQQCDALVQAVSSLGKGLKLPITAEGVESEAVHSKLAGLGCTDAQGWLFAEALTAEEVALGFLDRAAPAAKTEAAVTPRAARAAKG
ncbi:putative bifunctional diguanylate cyclase/phosphodiesterase [Tsuneonella sp. HG249]